MKAPSFTTFGNLIRNELTDSMEKIFIDVNHYIFEKDNVDLEHTYKVFEKIPKLIDSMNTSIVSYLRIKLEKRNEYAIDYITELLVYRHTIFRLRFVMNT